MAKAKVKWYGDKLIKEVGLKCFQNMEKACLLVEGDAKRMCPVDTGRLRASLSHEMEKKGDEVIGRVGTNIEYGVYVEYGTERMSAKPYLRPALENNKGKIKQLLGGK